MPDASAVSRIFPTNRVRPIRSILPNYLKSERFVLQPSAMSRRKVPTCMGDVKKSRRSYSGALTKAMDKLKMMPHDCVEEIIDVDKEEVERLLKSIMRTETNFMATLEEAQDYAPEGEEEDTFLEEEDAMLETFEQAASAVRKLANEILALKYTQMGLADLSHDISSLQTTLTGKPDLDHSEQLNDLKTAFSTLREEWKKAGLPRGHTLKTELDACTGNIQDLAADIAGVRAVPGSATSSIKTERDRTKLPAITIPSFSGDILNWPTFWQKFAAAVHDHSDLPKSTKLAYLRTAITDPEAEILLNPAIDGPDTYERLVKELHQRYSRTKKIHRGLVNKLNNLPPAKYNSKELRRLLDSASSYVDCLRTTGQFTLEAVITSMVYSKLPYKLQVDWDDDRPENKVASYPELFEYLTKKILTLSDNQTTTTPEAKPPVKQEKRPERRQQPARQRSQVHTVAPSPSPSTQFQYKYDCHFCKPEKHPLFVCPKWTAFDVTQRLAHVKAKSLCVNCLGVGHAVGTCKSTYRCRSCSQAHHSTLHQESQPSQQVTATLSTSKQLPDALLRTAEVLLKGPDREIRARALLDSAAGLSLITHRMAKLLGLPMETSRTALTTLEDSKALGSEHLTAVMISPIQQSMEIPCTPAVLKKIVSQTPLRSFPPVENFPHLWGLQLADPTFNIPGPVDILLGNDVLLKLHGKLPPITHEDSNVGAVSTVFGWVITGTAPGPAQTQMPVYHLQPAISNEDLHKLAYDFWLGEEAEEKAPPQSEIDIQVEEHYTKHVKHNPPKDMYEVKLPQIAGGPVLGESRPQAVQRFHSTERTCVAKGQDSQFNEQIRGYLEAGHAEKVPKEELAWTNYYLPMHTVTKSSSTSTKMRIVFDASAVTSNGVSLNQMLQVGPTIQPTLSRLLLKFREYPVALTADISKMYREVGLAVKDRNLHRFVWRPTREELLQDYRMTRVTFGVSCSPYLAIRTLLQTARDHGGEHPQASHHIMKSFYVDDLLAGADSEEEAMSLIPEIRSILRKGGFNLCKWRSSSQTVLDTIPPELQEKIAVKEETTLEHSAYPKALGLRWDSRKDCMSPSINLTTHYRKTKRGIVSDIAKTYDVLGWISPAMLPMKVLTQRLWTKEQTWDGAAPVDVAKEHEDWRKELSCLTEKTVPRSYSLVGATVVSRELHGFCDASLTAYGAVVYLRTTYLHQAPTIRLVTAKTKVNKKKPPTIPRLELCATVLLTKLLTTVSEVLDIPLQKITAWSDSSIVLAWLDGNTRTGNQYVYTRVYYVLEHTEPQTWKHVPGISNPADCASRGITPSTLLNHPLWWEGPEWLHEDPIVMPAQPPRKAPPTTGGIAVLITQLEPDFSLRFEERVNNYYTIIIVVAWGFRLYDRLKDGQPVPDDRGKRLDTWELERAEHWLLRREQQRCFGKEVKSLQALQSIAPTSRLRALTPMIDAEGLLRVGGRLKNSSLSKFLQHPIIVDSKSTLIQKLFNYKHIHTGHGGPSLLLCHTSKKLYVLGARRLARSICRNCVTCRRHNPDPIPQQMGELPDVRVRSDQPAFSDTGMDFAGPFDIRQGHTRRPVIIKAHICIFVCMATKAVHLEVTSDLTTESFVACLRRFVARRNCPKTIRCDNGPNFTGAKNELRQLYQFLQKKETDKEIHEYLLRNRIQWLNTPAAAPHFGGLWESAVRSMKKHLRRMMGTLIMTFEELTTISCQVEAFLNSRPLMPITSHNTDGLIALTPGHFLFLDSPRAYPEDPSMPEEPKLLQRWEKCQSVARHLWSRWSREYLHMLQARTKWQHVRPNLQVNDIVIFKPVGEFACRWPLAKIIAVHPGEDGLVRVATIQEPRDSNYKFPDTKKRPVAKLSLVYRPDQTVSTSSASPGRMFGQEPLSPNREQPETAQPEEGCQTLLPPTPPVAVSTI